MVAIADITFSIHHAVSQIILRNSLQGTIENHIISSHTFVAPQSTTRMMRPKGTEVPLESQPSLQAVFGTTELRTISDDCTRASESTFSDLEFDSTVGQNLLVSPGVWGVDHPQRPRYGHSCHHGTDLEISQPEKISFEFISGPSFSYKYQQLDAEQLQHDVLAVSDSSEALAYRQMVSTYCDPVAMSTFDVNVHPSTKSSASTFS